LHDFASVVVGQLKQCSTITKRFASVADAKGKAIPVNRLIHPQTVLRLLNVLVMVRANQS